MRTEQYLQIGKAVAAIFWDWASKKGIPPSEAAKVLVPTFEEAIKALDEVERLREENRRLKLLVREYLPFIDPLARLDRGIQLTLKLVELKLLAEVAGMELDPRLEETLIQLIEEEIQGAPLREKLKSAEGGEGA